MSKQSENRVAVITGGAKGIGAAICKRFSLKGATVIIADVDEIAGKNLTAEIAARGGSVKAYWVGVQDRSQITDMVERVSQSLAVPDILVNNAGTMDRAGFLEMSDEFWRRVHGINLNGALLCAQVTARKMVARGLGGKIVNVASNSGIFGGNGRAAYGASKAGLINLTQTMAIELAEHDILVNALAPGPTKTGDHMPDKPWPSVSARMPLARFGRPEEIAAMALFLASDECSSSTGHVFCADGGFTISGIMEA